MTNQEYKTIEELLNAYGNGQRQFIDWDFAEDGSVAGKNLSNVEFRNCFLFQDFRDANLSGAKFIRCNIKMTDFRGANLTQAVIKNCAVESAIFKGAITKELTFEENFCYGSVTQPSDFEKIFKDTGIEDQ